MLDKLKNQTIALARSPHAERGLFAVSFAESSFFPIPPDLLLMPMAALEPSKWLRYALTCTIASVLGGIAGYLIGMFLFETVGHAIISFFHYQDKQADFRAFYDKWGLLAVFIAGLTPIPYKLFTILSGAMSFSFPLFVFGSVVTRGLRFFLVAWLAKKYGPALAPVIEKRLGLALLAVAALVVIGIVAVKLLH